ncbi:MAG: DUF3105 domain-containing protein [Propionibacteriales bacterium]|nr:DUF3105 domain-containing protein [Propionibacteriales bacterium]
MAKKSEKNTERRAMVEQMRTEQARKERMRSLAILGVCVLIVAGLIGSAAFIAIKDSRDKAEKKKLNLASIGASATAAGCNPIESKPNTSKAQHIDDAPITYADAPPAFGNHRSVPATFSRFFYEAGDRPEVATLVHNLEHGYTIAWYDETLAKDSGQLDELKTIAEKYNLNKERFIAAPWLPTDGAAFPDGKHLALTRWSADASNPGDVAKQAGNWQYCSSVSGTVAEDFFKKWPNEQSPEVGLY